MNVTAGAMAAKEHKLLRVHRLALEELRATDLAGRCAAAGFRWDSAGARIAFLGEEFALDAGGTALTPAAPERETDAAALERHLAAGILILHYLVRTSGLAPQGRWVGFDQLPGGAFYGSTFRGRAEAPLARAFGACPRGLITAAAALGAGTAAYGDAAVVVPALPRVPVLAIVWQGDDELAPNAKVLFDAGAEEHLSTEDLTVLGELVTRRLRQGANTRGGEPPCPGS